MRLSWSFHRVDNFPSESAHLKVSQQHTKYRTPNDRFAIFHYIYISSNTIFVHAIQCWTNCNYVSSKHMCLVQCTVNSYYTPFKMFLLFLITWVSMNAEIIFKIHSLTTHWFIGSVRQFCDELCDFDSRTFINSSTFYFFIFFLLLHRVISRIHQSLPSVQCMHCTILWVKWWLLYVLSILIEF